jgi:hypothetical protein
MMTKKKELNVVHGEQYNQKEQYQWLDVRAHFKLLQDNTEFCAQLEHEAKKMPERELKEFIQKLISEASSISEKCAEAIQSIYALSHQIDNGYVPTSKYMRAHVASIMVMLSNKCRHIDILLRAYGRRQITPDFVSDLRTKTGYDAIWSPAITYDDLDLFVGNIPHCRMSDEAVMIERKYINPDAKVI